MALISSAVNLAKTIKNWSSGKTLGGGVGSDTKLRNTLYYFMPGGRKVKLKCIMCGYPRSGTHWIRNVIEKSTGQRTYDLYANIPSSDVEDILLVKIHARNRLIARGKAWLVLPPHKFDGKYIYTYRDPRDTIISLFEMYKSKKGLPHLEAKEFVKFYDPVRQYRWEIGAWIERQHNNVLLVKFEALKLDPLKEFQKIFDYLGITSEINKGVIDEKVAAADKAKRPRAGIYGWKQAPRQYRWLVDFVSEKLEREIRLLGYDFE